VGGSGGIAPHILTLALYGSKWSPTSPDPFMPTSHKEACAVSY